MSLDAIFKAYDIRGDLSRRDRRGARAPHRQRVRALHRRAAGRRRPRHAAVVGAARRRVHRGRDARRRRRHRHRAVLDRRRLLRGRARSTRPARCSPRATTPRSTTASSCAGPAPRRSASRPACSRSRRWSRRASRRAARSPGKVEHVDLLDEFGEHVRSFVDRSVLRPLDGRRRHRQRHGRPRRAEGVRRSAVLADRAVRRARRHVPEPPGRSDPAREPQGPAARGRSTSAPTSGSRSTATPIACSSSTTTASR